MSSETGTPIDLSELDLSELDLSDVVFAADLDRGGNLKPVASTGTKLMSEPLFEAIRMGQVRNVVIAKGTQGLEALRQRRADHDYRLIDQQGHVSEVLAELLAHSAPRQAIRRYEHEACSRIPLIDEGIRSGPAHLPMAEQFQLLPLLLRPKISSLEETTSDGGVTQRNSMRALRQLDTRGWEERLARTRREGLEAVSLQQLLQDQDDQGARVVLLAPPGGGKSTLLRYLAWRLSHPELTPTEPVGPTEALLPQRPKTLPVRLELRAWQASNQGLPEFLAHHYGPDVLGSLAPEAAQWRRWLRHGELLLLLDGLDELKGESSGSFAERLAILERDEAKRCPAVVTCRTLNFEYHTSLFSSGARDRWSVVFMDGLSETQQQHYVRAYFHPEERTARRLINALNEQPGLATLTVSPLILALTCYVTGEENLPPSSRVQLYDRAISRLLLRASPRLTRIEEALLADNGLSTPASQRRYLEWLALELFAPEGRRSGIFSRSGAHQLLIKRLEQENSEHNGPQLLARVADALLLRFEAIGLLRFGADGSDGTFLHLTLQEFLAASALARLLNQDDPAPLWSSKSILELLEARSGTPAWHEVLLFTIGQLDQPWRVWESLLDPVRDDRWRHRLALAAESLGDCRAELIAEEKLAVAEIREPFLAFWWQEVAEAPLEGVCRASNHLCQGLRGLFRAERALLESRIANRLSGNDLWQGSAEFLLTLEALELKQLSPALQESYWQLLGGFISTPLAPLLRALLGSALAGLLSPGRLQRWLAGPLERHWLLVNLFGRLAKSLQQPPFASLPELREQALQAGGINAWATLSIEVRSSPGVWGIDELLPQLKAILRQPGRYAELIARDILLEWLRQLPVDQTPAVVERLLADRSDRLRIMTLDVIGSLPPVASQAALESLLRRVALESLLGPVEEGNPRIQLAALQALRNLAPHHLGDDALEWLLELGLFVASEPEGHPSQTSVVQTAAADAAIAILKRRPNTLTEPMQNLFRAALRNAKQPDLQRSLLIGLSELGTTGVELVEEYRRFLRFGTNPELRAAAADAMATLELSGANPRLQRSVRRALERSRFHLHAVVRASALRALLTCFPDATMDPRRRTARERAILRYAEARNPYLQAQAVAMLHVESLRGAGLEPLLPALITLLQAKADFVRASTVEVIATLPVSARSPLLTESLRSLPGDPSPQVRRALAKACSQASAIFDDPGFIAVVYHHRHLPELVAAIQRFEELGLYVEPAPASEPRGRPYRESLIAPADASRAPQPTAFTREALRSPAVPVFLLLALVSVVTVVISGRELAKNLTVQEVTRKSLDTTSDIVGMSKVSDRVVRALNTRLFLYDEFAPLPGLLKAVGELPEERTFPPALSLTWHLTLLDGYAEELRRWSGVENEETYTFSGDSAPADIFELGTVLTTATEFGSLLVAVTTFAQEWRELLPVEERLLGAKADVVQASQSEIDLAEAVSHLADAVTSLRLIEEAELQRYLQLVGEEANPIRIAYLPEILAKLEQEVPGPRLAGLSLRELRATATETIAVWRNESGAWARVTHYYALMRAAWRAEGHDFGEANRLYDQLLQQQGSISPELHTGYLTALCLLNRSSHFPPFDPAELERRSQVIQRLTELQWSPFDELQQVTALLTQLEPHGSSRPLESPWLERRLSQEIAGEPLEEPDPLKLLLAASEGGGAFTDEDRLTLQGCWERWKGSAEATWNPCPTVGALSSSAKSPEVRAREEVASPETGTLYLLVPISSAKSPAVGALEEVTSPETAAFYLLIPLLSPSPLDAPHIMVESPGGELPISDLDHLYRFSGEGAFQEQIPLAVWARRHYAGISVPGDPGAAWKAGAEVITQMQDAMSFTGSGVPDIVTDSVNLFGELVE